MAACNENKRLSISPLGGSQTGENHGLQFLSL